MEDLSSIVFGPVPSRRLGRSLGVNNIPPKLCSYSCVYCQLGRTLSYSIERRQFYDPKDLVDAVSRKVEEIESRGERIDYITFVPDGEPTLDVNLGKEIDGVKGLGIKTAVISNSSLISLEEVRSDLSESDWVSLKIDELDPKRWIRINRPYGSTKLDDILEGIRSFSAEYGGYLATETMLVKGIQDAGDIEMIADFINSLESVKRSYIAVPTRPPAEIWVAPPDEDFINTAFQIFSEILGSDKVEYLIGYEGDDFSVASDVITSLLSITSVHPMKKEAIEKALAEKGYEWSVFEKLVNDKRVVELKYRGETYFMRKIRTR
ncbi:radical SAM protein [Thermoplasma sp.]|uniref:radical SAM protein n=1 Tax=Thermoplasma sp. TaxID=1973142 RepID=UPI0026137009|nr:radical SAM protein [Thermoplasma sp.]